MVENLSLLSNAGRQAPLLVDIWDRSSMDLTDAQFDAAKFATIKDLSKVWKAVSWTPPTAIKPPDAADELLSSSSSSSSAASSNGDADIDSESGAAGQVKGKKWSYKDIHWTQYDTILIDDSPSKACLQPHNHIQIPAYKPHDIQAIARSAAGSGPNRPGYPGGGAGQDTCLLQLIGQLEKIKMHSNVSAAIRSGLFSLHAETGRQWAQAGKDVLLKKGITVSENFDRGWADRLLGVSRPIFDQCHRECQRLMISTAGPDSKETAICKSIRSSSASRTRSRRWLVLKQSASQPWSNRGGRIHLCQ